MKRVALVLVAVALLAAFGCATCFKVEHDKKNERLYGPAVTLQELLGEFRGKSARASSDDLTRRWRTDAKRSDFMGRWTGSYEIKCRALRRSDMDGKYRQITDTVITKMTVVYEFSFDGKMTMETTVGNESSERTGVTMVGEWSFDSGRMRFVVGKGREHIGGLRRDGMLEIRERNVNLDGESLWGVGNVLYAFYDDSGCKQALRQDDSLMLTESVSPRVFRLVKRFEDNLSPEEDVRLSRAVMLKNLGQLRDSGVITEEEYKKERRKIEEGGK